MIKSKTDFSYKLKIKKVKLYSKIRLFLYSLFNPNVNLIINDCTPTKLTNEFKEYIDLEFVINLFKPLLIGNQNVITVKFNVHHYSSYCSIICYSLKIDSNKEYKLEYFVDNHRENKNHYKLSIEYVKYRIQEQIFNGQYNPKSHNELYNTQKVMDDNSLLGFEPAIDIELPESLCMTCAYFTGNHHLKCTVNPMQLTRTCYECRDFIYNPDKKYDINDYY